MAGWAKSGVLIGSLDFWHLHGITSYREAGGGGGGDGGGDVMVVGMLTGVIILWCII